MNRQNFLGRCLAGAAVLAAGCGGGGVSVGVSGIPVVPMRVSEPVASIGVITSATTLVVNGVRFDTRAATVTLNGSVVTAADLEPGLYVYLAGDIHAPGLQGSAERIDAEASVIGPAESIDPVGQRLEVLGQTVLYNRQTRFGAGIDRDDLTGLDLGAALRVSGFPTADGSLLATRIERHDGDPAAELIGRVDEHDSGNLRFRIGDMMVDYASVLLIEIPGGTVRDGMFVLVRGQLVDGVLHARELSALPGSGIRNVRERTYLEGLVTGIDGARAFLVHGFRVSTSTLTRYEGGLRTDLVPDVHVRVYGRVSNDGATIVADEVEFRRQTQISAAWGEGGQS